MLVADPPRTFHPQPSLTEQLVDISSARAAEHATNKGSEQFSATTDYLQTPRIRLFVSPEITSSSWFRPVLEQLTTAMTLPRNWDSYGGRPVMIASVEKAVLFLLSNMRTQSLPPTVVPMSDGGVQLVWHDNGVDIEVSFGESAGSEELYVRDATADHEFEGPVVTAEARRYLNEAFQRLDA
jgi:hypothetical protein